MYLLKVHHETGQRQEEKTGQRHFSKRITCQNYFSFLVKHGTTQMTLYLLFMLRWKNHKI